MQEILCPVCLSPLYEVFFGEKIKFRCWRCMNCQEVFTEEELKEHVKETYSAIQVDKKQVSSHKFLL